MLYRFFVIVVCVLVCPLTFAEKKGKNPSVKPKQSNKSSITHSFELYEKGQKEFTKAHFDKASDLFEEFVMANKGKMNDETKKRVFWSIDMIMRIQLRVNKSPKKAILFLEKINKSFQLNDSDFDTIQEWLAVAKEWQGMGKIPKNISSEQQLYDLGKKFYDRGHKKSSAATGKSGNADLYIAATYLIPFVYNFNNSKNIGEVLYMLGTIRKKSWNDYDYWSENFYLKEVIQRFPHTDLAKKSYTVLEEGIRFGYTGSGGDFTPPSQIEMLKVYKQLAGAEKLKKPIFY